MFYNTFFVLLSHLWCTSRFSGYFMGNSHNNQPGRLYTSLAMLVTGGKRNVALGRKEQADNSLEGFTLVFHYSNILSAVYISESFSWVVCCTCCICCLKNHNQLCLACNKENNKYNLYNLYNFPFSKRLEHLGDTLFLLLHVWVNIEVECCCNVGMTEQYAYGLVVAVAFYAACGKAVA